MTAECDCGCETVAACDGDCGGCSDAVTLGPMDGDLARELAELRKRIESLEEAQQALARRRICALMTDVDALERTILARDVTTADLKKAGLRALGLDR